MSINFERLDAAITYAAEHPDEFDMASFFARRSCGTTACLAGTAAIQAGWRPVWGDDDGWPGNETYAVTQDGETEEDAFDVAASLLGFGVGLAEEFFFAPSLAAVIHSRNHYAIQAGLPERIWTVTQ